MSKLPDLLREMLCACETFGHEIGKETIPVKVLCRRCRALTLAEELERQLAAAQAALLAVEHDQLCWANPNQVELGRCVCWMTRVEDALANGTAALDAHDERVRREALEAAADALILQADPKMWIAASWLRDRAKATT